ncbi:MAG: GNAT family N-acetyltransferase [Flavobacteriaceae bacterium]
MITYSLSQSQEELEQILSLQQANLGEQLSIQEKQQEGFVTVKHTLEMLKKLNQVCPHIIAKWEGRVIGYALCMHPKFEKQIEILRPMFDEIQKKISTEEDYLVMGQICVDKRFRKQGVFRKLYTAMKEEYLPPYSQIITEVDTKNIRSLKAHYAVGFQKLSSYASGGQDWEVIFLK